MRNRMYATMILLAKASTLFGQKPGDDFGGYPAPETFPGCHELGFTAAAMALFAFGHPAFGYASAIMALAYATWCS